MKETTSAGRYFISGECRDGRSISRGDPHQHLSHSHNLQILEHHPPADAAELQENANKVLEELLTTKASVDAHRQRAIWELGMELCQNESQVTESIREAKSVCSHVTLDAKALRFATVKEAKAICCSVTLDAKAVCLATVKEAKMT